MGPRLISRGNDLDLAEEGGRQCRFNGAATDQSRKCSQPSRPYRAGIASMGPRLISRGNMAKRAHVAQGIRLQWGRD